MVNTLYKLTPAESDTLSNLDQEDVIAAGPWRKGAMSLARRAVIRELGPTKYVVHTQVVGESTAYYEQGVYIDEPEMSERLTRALVAFDKKLRLHHSLETFTREWRCTSS